jgi:hypothetical protein
MATPMRHAPVVEPSTDFPTLDLVRPLPEPERPGGTMALVLLVSGALLVGSMGFALGRATAPIPAECQTAVALAERASTLAVQDLTMVREGMLVFLDGELPEAYSILGDATLGVDQLQTMQRELVAAAETCLGS